MATVPPSPPGLGLLDLLNIVPLELVARILDCGDAWCRAGPQRGTAMAPRLVCKAMRDLVDGQAVNVHMCLTQRRSGVLPRLLSCRSLHVSLLRYDPLHDFSPMMERLAGPPGGECLRHCEYLTLALRTDFLGAALYGCYVRKRAAVLEGMMATARLAVALARTCPNVTRLELHPCFHVAWPEDLDTQQAAAAYSSLGEAFSRMETLCVPCVACLVGVQALRGSGVAAIQVQQATGHHRGTDTMHTLTSQGVLSLLQLQSQLRQLQLMCRVHNHSSPVPLHQLLAAPLPAMESMTLQIDHPSEDAFSSCTASLEFGCSTSGRSIVRAIAVEHAQLTSALDLLAAALLPRLLQDEEEERPRVVISELATPDLSLLASAPSTAALLARSSGRISVMHICLLGRGHCTAAVLFSAKQRAALVRLVEMCGAWPRELGMKNDDFSICLRTEQQQQQQQQRPPVPGPGLGLNAASNAVAQLAADLMWADAVDAAVAGSEPQVVVLRGPMTGDLMVAEEIHHDPDFWDSSSASEEEGEEGGEGAEDGDGGASPAAWVPRMFRRLDEVLPGIHELMTELTYCPAVQILVGTFKKPEAAALFARRLAEASGTTSTVRLLPHLEQASFCMWISKAVSDMWRAAGRGRHTDAAAADVDALAALYSAAYKTLQGVYEWSRGKQPYEVDPIVDAHAADQEDA